MASNVPCPRVIFVGPTGVGRYAERKCRSNAFFLKCQLLLGLALEDGPEIFERFHQSVLE